ncbi:unnamed protein product [Oppiella nova]|uniref:LRAT domain-containing protein n=1 Tax=Oppiella nova TaxID=334625 RepID=A0A7R9QB49_9ACAR|nr:unnamed protein product [Oppiella nova]CAG2162122.1 unnamed protein product [Oppiella nova]
MGSVQSKSLSMSSSESMCSFGRTGSFLEYDRVKHLLSRGDLIEVLRGRYRHWVFFESVDYYGNVMCFHITAVHDGDADDKGTDLTRTGVRKEMSFNGKALLKYEPLEDILKDADSPQPSLCRINNQEIMASQMLKITGNQCQTWIKFTELRALHHVLEVWHRVVITGEPFKDISTAALKTVSTLCDTTSRYLQHNGCFIWGIACLLISVVSSVVSSMAAKVVEEEIDLTLKTLKLEDIIRQSTAN